MPFSPDDVARHGFGTSFRGFDQGEVRAYLAEVAAALQATRAEIESLQAELAEVREVAAHPVLDEATLMQALGEETARIVRSAHEAAADIKAKAEENVTRILRDAHDQADALRASAESVLVVRTAEAEEEAELLLAAATEEADQRRSRAAEEAAATTAAARAEADAALDEADARYRAVQAEVAALEAGRDRLLDAYRTVRIALDDATTALGTARRATGGPATAAPPPSGPGAPTRSERGTPPSVPEPVEEGPGAAAAVADPGGPHHAQPLGAPGASPIGPGPVGPGDTRPAAVASTGSAAPAPVPALPASVAAVALEGDGARPATSPPAGDGEAAHLRSVPDLPAPPPVAAAGVTVVAPRAAEAVEPVRQAPSPLRIVGRTRPGGTPTEIELQVVEPPSPVEAVRVVADPVPVPTAPPAPPTGAVDREVGPLPTAPANAGAASVSAGPTSATSTVDPAPATAGGPAEASPAPAAPSHDGGTEGGRSEADPAAPGADGAPDNDGGALTHEAPAGAAPDDGPGAAAEASTVGGGASESAGPAPAPASLDDLFARLKADRADAVAKARAVLADEQESGSEAGPPGVDAPAGAPPAGTGPAAPASGPAAGGASAASAAPAAPAVPVVPGDGDGASASPADGAAASAASAEGATAPEAVAPAASAGAPSPDARQAPDGVDAEPAVSDADEALLQQRDAAIEAAGAALARKLKRRLQDDQNELLDRLRSAKGRGAGSLGDQADQEAAMAAVAVPALSDAARAGAAFAGADSSDPTAAAAEIASQLAAAVVAPLRRRIDKVLVDTDDREDRAERVSAAYREWKAQRIERLAGDSVAAAFCRAAYDATPDGTPQRWLVDDGGGACPDCDDNGLAGPNPKGQPFPTGQLHPPAHAGCRCLLVP